MSLRSVVIAAAAVGVQAAANAETNSSVSHVATDMDVETNSSASVGPVQHVTEQPEQKPEQVEQRQQQFMKKYMPPGVDDNGTDQSLEQSGGFLRYVPAAYRSMVQKKWEDQHNSSVSNSTFEDSSEFAGGFDYSNYVNGDYVGDSSNATGSSQSSEGFDYSRYMGGNATDGSRSGGDFDYSKYMGGAIQMGGMPSQMGNADSAHSPGGFDYSKYMSGAGHTADSSKATDDSQSGEAQSSGGFDYSKYMGGAIQSKTDNTDSHSRGGFDYSKYIGRSASGNVQGSPHSSDAQSGGFDYSKYTGGTQEVASEGSQGVASESNASDVGFQRYMQKYLPPGDKDQYSEKWTHNWNDQTASYADMHSTGQTGYDQYVSKYSSMAGKNPSAPGSWQEKEKEQRGAYESSVGQQIKSYTQSRSAAGESSSAAVESPSNQHADIAVASDSETGDTDVQLAASAPKSLRTSSRPGQGAKFVLYIFVGLSLPAAISFVKAMRSTVLSRPAAHMQEAGQHLLA